jgi:hypothetical protein
MRLEKASAERTFTLTDEQIETLQWFRPEFRERHIEAHCTGDLLAVGTFFVGHLKGLGKVSVQRAIDCCSALLLGPLQDVVTTVHLLNTDVLPKPSRRTHRG